MKTPQYFPFCAGKRETVLLGDEAEKCTSNQRFAGRKRFSPVSKQRRGAQIRADFEAN